MNRIIRATALSILLLLTPVTMVTAEEVSPATQPSSSPPAVGGAAIDFTLPSLAGQDVQLNALSESGPVVLVVLRGWPGYQCPLCSRQVGEFLGRAEDFANAGASVVMIYPGPSEMLRQHAEEFAGDMTLPDNFYLLIDADYAFTNAYGLRWDAPNETAYPSTFVVGSDNILRYAKISRTHGDRADADEVLAAIPEPAGD